MPPSKRREETSSEESSDEDSSSPPPIARKGKFDDEDEDSDVLDSWDAAEDSEVEREKLKKATEAKAKADLETAANKKSKAQRIEERRTANMKKKLEDDGDSTSEEDTSVTRAEARQREQDADLKHAEDLIGNIGINKSRSDVKTVVVTDPSNPNSAIDLSTLPLFKPTSKDQFAKLRETLVPVLIANSQKAHYPLFMQEFSKQIVKDLPSEHIKKIASGLTTLSNERMKEEKAAEKGGKKTKAAKSKATLVANRDTSQKADTTAYDDLG
ncbi:uncharacterized protein KY384_009079 [Bacidia gigantensis]|uniref:uncharacterized protein n=1 Tax=Bacidia gigantensis TaxID=2732470 RepID=UPI001D0522C6|nr:uncharacterized protein KY384_009079 [Bacidia gigantensis]KAG8525435.1 hypothetical protein KY384_009079 [Bacidia gigantensis]